ncbi:MAG: hypothetical protein JWM04_1038 [Verrucomicrobiales bacterium]|nr:hypothetical protein [Verrucomicrobiales bacterium]
MGFPRKPWRCWPGCFLFMAVVMCGPGSRLQAHHLAGYLQSSLILVRPASIEIEIYLTPGIDVALAILKGIDTDQSGEASATEAQVYGAAAARDMTLEVDGVRVPLSVDSIDIPAFDSLRKDDGYITLTVSGKLKNQTAGDHSLTFKNHHEAKIGAYLVNALVPGARSIEIVRQTRNEQQSEIRIEYVFNEGAGTNGKRSMKVVWPVILMGSGMAGAAAFLHYSVRRRGWKNL